ncbi:MAG: HYR domain-containing protein [Planctomycetota bacterium]|nr:HYR domain-containing protein [Planctomycetota bacterium]
MFPRIDCLIATLFIGIALSSPDLIAQCQPTVDCNQNGVDDQCDLDFGSSDDCNGNNIPDECDIEFLTSEDCNLDGIPDECEPGIQELIGLGLAFGQGFGSSIDSTPQYAVVGAPLDDLLGTNTGSANIFRRIGSQWIEEMKIFGIAAGVEDRFGESVAVEDDLVAIGAPGKFLGRGAVYLYRRVGNGWWNYEGTVTAFDAQPGWAFGTSVDLDSGMLVVGATMSGTGNDAGAVYLYSQSTGMWLLEQKLEAGDQQPGDNLGASVKMFNGKIAAGAPGRDSGGLSNSGAVVIFQDASGLWIETEMKTSGNPQPFGEYGTSLDMNQEHLVVGAPGEDGTDGAAYLYDRLSYMWINPQRFTPSVPEEIGSFGSDVALGVRTIVISAPFAGDDQGNVCLLRQEGGIWNPVSNLVSINDQDPGEKFGSSISCQIPFLLVGCSGEDYGETVWISAFTDCNLNLEDDICDVTQGLEPDCNLNRIPDSCELDDGTKQDCDGNGIPDECQIASGDLIDCNINGIPDDCDIADGFSLDCNIDGIPDDCQEDADPFHPVISNLPDPISVIAEEEQCGATITWTVPGATDDCGLESLVSSHQPGDFFSPGLTIVTYTATDVSGNVSNAMFTILVNDEQAPGLEGLPGVVAVQAPIDSCEAQASWNLPTPVDNCGIFALTSSHSPGSTFPVGETTVTYTVMDVSGNTAEFSFAVEVMDNHFPEITGMPENITMGTDPDSCTAAVNWSAPLPEDDCTIASFLSSHQSGDSFPVGTTDVSYTVSDSSGLIVTETFTISVQDDQLPVFTSVPSSMTLGNDPDSCGAVVTWIDATATDNCELTSISYSKESGSTFDVGTTVVTITALDVNGNTAQHQFDITVQDTQAPTLTGVPADMTIGNDPAQCYSVVNWALPVMNDNCSVASFTGTHDSGFAFPLGSTTVNYSVTDSAGNSLESSFVVTVNDIEMPILVNMPVSLTVVNDEGQCGANVEWEDPVPWDNCSLTDFDASHQSGAHFPVGTTAVNFEVVDGNGQLTTASFEITVDDEEAPKINGMPADRTITAEAGLCSATNDWIPPVPSDNCEIVSFTASHQPGDSFSAGTTEVSYIAVDSAGIVITDQFLITVLDSEIPEIIRIPEDIVLSADADVCSAVAEWILPDSQDNCGISMFNVTHASGDSFAVGVTTVDITTEDLHGNTAAASFTVTVLDEQVPALSGIPADIEMTAELGLCGATVSWDEPVATDNCESIDLNSNVTSGSFFDIGTTVVTYSVSDSSGNISESSFTVSINDDQHPEFLELQELVSVPTDAGACEATVNWEQHTVVDNCSVSTITSSHQSGEIYPLGDTLVDLLATDVNGNETAASFTIRVVDQELPQIFGLSGDLEISNEQGVCGATVNWDEPVYMDNCSATGLGSDIPNGAFFAVGTTTVTYSAVDLSGNENSLSFSVTVTDNENPVFVGLQEVITTSNSPGLCSAAVTWEAPEATDNCGMSGISVSHDSGQVFPVGDTVISLLATDVNGNDMAESFIVRVLDEEAPVLSSLPQDRLVQNEPGQCSATVVWDEPVASDNCEALAIEVDRTSGSQFDVGTSVVTFSVSDTAGLITTGSFEITVVDLELPTITAIPADITLIANPGTCVAQHEWVAPESADNCMVISFISNFESGDSFSVGSNPVSYTAQDPTGNIHTETFTVTVLDQELPMIHDVPADIQVSNDTGLCAAVVDWVQETSSDNCSVEEHVSSHMPGDTFDLGTTVVEISATDPSGNVTTDSFTVTVVDDENPLILGLPADIQQDSDPGVCGATVTWEIPTPSDNCQALELTSDIDSGSIFPLGGSTITYSVEDSNGNLTTESFVVTIDDVEAPSISGMPSDAVISAEPGGCGANFDWIPPTIDDNCSISQEISTHQSGDFFDVGSTTVTYTATDPAGNETVSSFTVIVEDDESPAITSVPLDVTVSTDAGMCGSVHLWDSPIVTDNCGIDLFQQTHNSGDQFPVGGTTVVFTVQDLAGNVMEEQFVITVIDDELPQISGVSGDIQVDIDPGLCSAVVNWVSETSSDNCAVLEHLSSHQPGDTFDLGTTLVEITVSDVNGNASNTSFTVTVSDNEPPAIIGLPQDITVDSEAGVCGAVIDWIEPTASDNCQTLLLGSDIANGTLFEIGNTVVTYSVDDPSGNMTSASFTVTVLDAEAPVIIGIPQNIETVAPEGSCTADVSWIEPTAVDCISFELSADVVNGSAFDIGNTIVTYTATDPAGNTNTDSFTVTVLDQEQPAITGLPELVQVDSTPGSCSGVANWIEPEANDCSGILSLDWSHASGTIFPVGNTEVTYTATDGIGNVSTASFTVQVDDAESPMIHDLSADINLIAEAGLCGATASWDEPTSSDNCQDLGLSSNILSGSFFDVGTTTVTYSVSDTTGNLTEESFLVIVHDTQNPVIEGVLVDVIIGNQPGVCGATHEWVVPDFLDNCGVAEVVASHQPGDFFSEGLTTITYLITDFAGLTAEDSFTVQVADLEVPQILTMPEDVVLENDPGVCGAAHFWELPETFDNCDVSALVSNHQPGDIFPLGQTTVTYTAQDPTGNVVSDQFMITVNDLEGPVFNGLPDVITVNCDPGSCTAQVDWVPPVPTDNCELLDFSISAQPGDTFTLGTSTVSLQGSDIHGNESFATFTVVVVDQEAPVITEMPADITLTAFGGFCGAVVHWDEPGAADNCQQLGVTADLPSGSFFDVGSTLVTYSVSDPSGNSSEASFTVTVTDDEAPQFSSIPVDFTIPTDPGLCGAVVSWPEPSATDNCAIESLVLDLENHSFLEKGEYFVTAIVTDVHGNSLTETFTVTVADMELPILIGMAEDITINVMPDECKAVASWIPPTTSDNCGEEILASNYSPDTYFVVGVTEVRYVVTDSSGNNHEETFNVIVVDEHFPVIEGVPADIEINTESGICTTVVDWIQETSSDNCWIQEHTSSKMPGDVFDLGLTTVEISATDPSGNESTASFTVTVVDNEAPQLLNMPEDITLGTDPGSCGAMVTWAEPTPFDNCETINFISDISNGSFFDVGSTVVTYSIEDPSGNSHSDSFTVIVTEDGAPEITSVPSDAVINVQPGVCGSTFEWIPPVITDNCTVAQEFSTHQPGDLFGVGSTTVTYTAIDTAGNETSVGFVVTVEDDEHPVIASVPLDVTISTDAGVCGAVHEWIATDVTDNCEIDIYQQSHNSGDQFLAGQTTVVFTAQDLAGNLTEQQFVITVIDDEAPVISGVSADIQIDTDPGQCSAVVDWVSETSSDNCGVLQHTSSHQPGDVFDLGMTTVEIIVVDLHDNTSIATFSVTVVDTEAPAIVDLPQDFTAVSEAGVCGAIIDWIEPTSTDNCETVGLASDLQSGTLFDVGTTAVTYTVGDPSGNLTTASFLVTVTDDEAPTITEMPLDVSMTAQPGVCGSTFEWIHPTIGDNCAIATQESTHQPGEFFEVGSTTVTYTTTDTAGHVTSASFNVEVLDEEVPVIGDMPVDTTISIAAGTCSAGFEWPEPTATDNCAIASLTSNIQTGHIFVLGTTTVTYTAVDSAGLVTDAHFNLTVIDDEAPVISSVPDRVLVNTGDVLCTAVAEWISPTADDNCELISFTSSHASGDVFPTGDTDVILVAIDAAGNMTEVSFLVTVTDIQIPTIIGLPVDFNVVTNPGICGALVSWDNPFAVDNCGVDSLTTDVPSGTFMEPGVTSVTYTAIDVNGNTLITGFDVTVVDSELPQFVAPPADIQIHSESGLCDAEVVWNEIIATDNCGVQSIESTHTIGDRFPVGITEVAIVATDLSGNFSTHSFFVTVLDGEVPLVTAMPLDTTVENDLGVCGALVSWEEPVASDNCTVEILDSNHLSGDLFEVGDTLITYIATDSSGNTTDVGFTVTVLDTEAPQIGGLPISIEAFTDAGECTAVVDWELPTYSDNCAVFDHMSTHVPGDVFPIGETVVTYGVSDVAGLESTYQFVVTISDQEQPQINSLPDHIVVSNDQGLCGTDVSWSSPSATDNCGISNLTSDIENSSFFALGTTTVTYSAVDVHGNTTEASFLVTVEDTEAPVLNGLPVAMDLDSDLDLCGAVATWAVPESIDNCEVSEVTQTHASGDFFPVGTTTVTYMVIDTAGNDSTYTFDITVTDVQGPSISGLPDLMELENTTAQCGTNVVWEEPVIEDACGTTVVSSSHSSGEFFPVGDTEVVYNVTDSAGNETVFGMLISVRDTELPIITSIPENQVVTAAPGHCAAAVNWVLPTATDNCDIGQLVTSFYSGMEYGVGTTTVMVVATDTSNNQVTASFQITVIDEEDPMIVGMPSDVTYKTESGICGASVTWLEPTGIDGCGLASFESSHESGAFFQVGTTVVTYVVIDISGNSVSDTFSVTIIDDESATITPPLPITVTAPPGECGSIVDVPELEVFDACGEVEVVNDYNDTANASGFYPRGNTLINWTATDSNGNLSFTAGIVTVLIDSPDCNDNNNPDVCDISTGTSLDCNLDGIPDECQPDCDGNGIPNDCEIAQGTATDCDQDGLPDSCEISSGVSLDCNNNGQPDSCDIESGVELDCNLDGFADSCQIASGNYLDCDGDGVIDSCELLSGSEVDCNSNGIPDDCDLAAGQGTDCNNNQVLDTCDLASGIDTDCNANGTLDVCDLASGTVADCDQSGVPDSCEISSGAAPDCNGNGIPDTCDLQAGIGEDCDSSGVPDSCEISSGAAPDCNGNGIPDSCDLLAGIGEDCDGSGVPDSCEVAAGSVPDCNNNGVPDSCDLAGGVADCDGNGIPDSCEIGNGQVADCNNNGIPDACDLASGLEEDCDGTGVPDSCEVFTGTASDCNTNGVPDSCDISSGVWGDCDLDGDIDSCEIDLGTEQDCNGTGIPDSCEIASGSFSDCNENEVPDTCELLDGTLFDCNGNSIPDACEISDGIEEDCNSNGIPDICDLASGAAVDLDGDGIPDSCQINFRRGDGNSDGIVNIADGVFLLVNLFAGGTDPGCDDAADANDDGSIDVSDVITILGFQFNGTSPPPAPFDSCGVDPTDSDGLGCVSYNVCP